MFETTRVAFFLLHFGTVLVTDGVYCSSSNTFSELGLLKDQLNTDRALTLSAHETPDAVCCVRHCCRTAECSAVQVNEISQRCQLLQSAPVVDVTVQEMGWRTYRKTCKVGYQEEAGICFKLYDVDISMANAQLTCAEDGGRLLRIQSQKQQDAVAGYLGAIDYQRSITVGGRLNSDVWTWEDGTLMQYFGWESSPAVNKSCIKLKSGANFLWATTQCSRDGPFLCDIKMQC